MGAIVIFISMVKSGKLFRSILLSALEGIGALFAVNLIGMLTGVTLAINWWTLAISATGGVAAVAAMVFAGTLV